MREIYYHYTKPEDSRKILDSKVIYMSVGRRVRGRRDDAVHGNGVYLTKLAPTSSKYEIAFNNYDGSRTDENMDRIIRTGKVDAYIRLELDSEDVIECVDENGRDIFLYEGRDLHITPDMNACRGFVEKHKS